jgi:hypothetical protein
LVISLSQNTEAVVPGVPYKTVSVPANFGGWVICSTSVTKFVGFSIRIAPLSSELSVDYGKSVTGNGTISSDSTNGFLSGVYDVSTKTIVDDSTCGTTLNKCLAVDRYGTLTPGGNVCVVVLNPTSNDLVINVVVSFTTNPFIYNGDVTNLVENLKLVSNTTDTSNNSIDLTSVFKANSFK